MEVTERTPFLSIIIPAYNVAKYLPRCIDSIIDEKREEIEVIIIDDGSQDESGMIADKYAKQNYYISVIHKSNGGLSEARNFGIKNAVGDYILFLDSDDYLIPGALEKVLVTIEEYNRPDICFCNVVCKKLNNKEIIGRKTNAFCNKILSGRDLLVAELKTGRFAAMVVLGIYNRKYLVDNQFYFKKGILHEDEEWSPRVLITAKRVVCVDVNYYGYELREDSITTKKDKTKNVLSLIQICKELKDFFSQFNSDVELVKLENRYLSKLYMGAIARGINYGNAEIIMKSYDKEFIDISSMSCTEKLRCLLFKLSPYIYARLFRFLC